MKNSRVIGFFSLFFPSLFLYIYTLAPNWGALNIFNTWDGLEYVLCSSLMGIDHPPGHPFYLLLARLFSSIFAFGSVAFRMNLFSAVAAAACVGVVYLIMELSLRLIGKPADKILANGAAVLTAATFAVSRVFWIHSSIIKAYTLFLFLAALLIYFVLRYVEERKKGWIYSAALVSGLLISTNIMNALTIILPVLAFFLIFDVGSGMSRLKAREWAAAAALFASGLLFYVYYPMASRMSPGFIHPMNLMSGRALGSLSWFIWYVSGAAWTGEGMFSLSRIFLNTPNYLRHAIDNFSIFSTLLFVFAAALGLKIIFDRFHLIFKDGANIKEIISEASTELKILFLFLLSYVIVLIPELSLLDVSNPGSSTAVYVANFYLSSFLLYVLIAGVGLGYALEHADRSDLLTKVLKFFGGGQSSSPAGKGAPLIIILYILFILPLYLLATNYQFCNLRDNDTGYRFGKGMIEGAPAGSVIYSKMVYQLVGTYFVRIENVLGDKPLTIVSPDFVVKNTPPTGNPMVDRANILKKSINENMKAGRGVYLAGDCIDADKAPEVLLMSDLLLEPRVSQGLLPVIAGPYPTELILYEVQGYRTAGVYHGTPKIDDRGISNDGTFSSMKLLGYSLVKDKAPGFGRNRINMDLYWKPSSKIPDDLLGVFVVYNEKMEKVDPGYTTSFFTLGGEDPASKWKPNAVMKDECRYYLPPLPAGRYFLGLGLIKRSGQVVPYYPASYAQDGRAYDFVMLLPFAVGGQPPY